MKTFFIAKEELSNVLTMLWDECSEKNARISIEPALGTIRIFKNNEMVVSITPLDIIDEYALKKAVLEEI